MTLPPRETELPAEMRTFDLFGTRLTVEDAAGSSTTQIVATELLCDEYLLRQIAFAPGDVVIDVGAHVGMVALWLALRHPEITVVAVEPEPLNLAHLRRNVAANGAGNLIIVPLALTADGRSPAMARPPSNSGGAGLYYAEVEGYSFSQVASTSLDEIFARFVPQRCRLLKMDCEGAEHEILPACQNLWRVDWFAAEFHMNGRLAARGCSNDGLAEFVGRFIARDRISVKSIKMGE